MKDDQDNSGMEIAQINDKMSTNKAFNWQTQDICCNDRKSDNLPRRETRLTFDKHLSWLCMKLTRGGIHKPRELQTGFYQAKISGIDCFPSRLDSKYIKSAIFFCVSCVMGVLPIRAKNVQGVQKYLIVVALDREKFFPKHLLRGILRLLYNTRKKNVEPYRNHQSDPN